MNKLRWSFHNMITTDGMASSFLFSDPKKDAEAVDGQAKTYKKAKNSQQLQLSPTHRLKLQDKRRILAFDPGRNDIVFGACRVTDRSGNETW